MPNPLFDFQGTYYHDYSQHSEYEFDDGLEVIPLAVDENDPPPHFAVVRRHAPIGRRRVIGQAAKSHTPPVMPELADTPSGDLFLGAKLLVMDPETRGPDQQTRTFAAAWEYEYVQGGAQDANATGGPVPATFLDRRHQAVSLASVKITPRLDTGRPPFVRIGVDAKAAAIWNLLGAVPLVGGFLVQLLGGPILDNTLNKADRTADVPQLGQVYDDYAVAYRPNYQTGGIIR